MKAKKIDVVTQHHDSVVIKQRTYESVIDELGGFGHWQRCIFLFIGIPDIFNGFAQMLPVYIGKCPCILHKL